MDELCDRARKALGMAEALTFKAKKYAIPEQERQFLIHLTRKTLSNLSDTPAIESFRGSYGGTS